MIIAILQRCRKNIYGRYDYVFTEENVNMFKNKGVSLFYVNDTIDKDFVVNLCDALYVPGGADVNPKLYGQEINGSVNINNETDALDYEYIEAFYKADKPILGICRGHQIINVYFGGSLIQNICNHSETEHNVIVENDSFINDIYNTKVLKVNSLHHQVVDKPGIGFRIVARSKDGYIEATQYKNVYTVQWHPEMYDADRFISYFIEKIENKNV